MTGMVTPAPLETCRRPVRGQLPWIAVDVDGGHVPAGIIVRGGGHTTTTRRVS